MVTKKCSTEILRKEAEKMIKNWSDYRENKTTRYYSAYGDENTYPE